jgi:hypothetical protein
VSSSQGLHPALVLRPPPIFTAAATMSWRWIGGATILRVGVRGLRSGQPLRNRKSAQRNRSELGHSRPCRRRTRNRSSGGCPDDQLSRHPADGRGNVAIDAARRGDRHSRFHGCPGMGATQRRTGRTSCGTRQGGDRTLVCPPRSCDVLLHVETSARSAWSRPTEVDNRIPGSARSTQA